ncbi:hypothetical protein ACH42_16390 [Endozoicomonas sp. (ex Bugula neritina AB1)]|nr:hypothetical protein ACH42_16390 [Endozoicomonas sp. (ex Bugula neritina AB1)]
MSVVVRRGVFIHFFSLFLLMGLSSSALAAKVSDLYKQEIPVNSQSESERQDAMGQALTNVLIKVTGQREALSLSQVRAAVQQPTFFVQSYSYHRDDQDGQRRQYLQVNFDEIAVNRLLRESNVAIWGTNRPTTLMWLAIEDKGSRQILSASAVLPQVMEGHFDTRGIPVILPLLDFEDSLSISAVDVWGLFADKLEAASQRYGADAILAGRLLKHGERYSGRLTFVFRGERYQADVPDLVAAGVASVASDLVAKNLAKHYAVTAGDFSEKPLLVVENIRSVEDYAALTNYLDKLTAVREVSVRKIQGSVIELELAIDGSVSQLSDALALGRALRAQPAHLDTVELELQNRLYYRWVAP